MVHVAITSTFVAAALTLNIMAAMAVPVAQDSEEYSNSDLHSRSFGRYTGKAATTVAKKVGKAQVKKKVANFTRSPGTPDAPQVAGTIGNTPFAPRSPLVRPFDAIAINKKRERRGPNSNSTTNGSTTSESDTSDSETSESDLSDESDVEEKKNSTIKARSPTSAGFARRSFVSKNPIAPLANAGNPVNELAARRRRVISKRNIPRDLDDSDSDADDESDKSDKSDVEEDSGLKARMPLGIPRRKKNSAGRTKKTHISSPLAILPITKKSIITEKKSGIKRDLEELHARLLEHLTERELNKLEA